MRLNSVNSSSLKNEWVVDDLRNGEFNWFKNLSA